MRTFSRHATVLILGLALVAGACSGGGDEAATTPVTTAPAAALPDSVGDALFDMLFEKPPTTSTTTPEDRIAAEAYIADLTKSYFLAAAAGEWDSVYEASATEFKDTCTPEGFAAVIAATDPVELTFDSTEVQVVGDFATGSFEVSDDQGSFRVEGLLASWEPDGWRVAIDPCDVAARIASGDFSYPIVLTTTTVAPAAPAPDGNLNPTDDAPIPPELTTTTTAPDAATTTTTADITGPNPEGEATTTTTTLPPVPLTAADEFAIESVIKQFLTAEAGRDYVTLHASVPPLFSCDATDTSDALSLYHWSPTTLTYSEFTITGANDEAFASFDVTFADTGETLTVTDFGAWEWGDVWYAAVHPCTWTELEVDDGAANQFVIDLLNDTLDLARTLYAGAGDYDIPTATLNALSDDVEWVGTADQAGIGTIAYVDSDQELLIITQSNSGRWYCIAEDAVLGEHYGSAALAPTVDTIDGCRSVTLTNPFGPPIA
ncbi:MAG: hypothetical protein HKO63_08435 [Acidimicrobiia bacterium]|nr:hypothetical protein [Acidimicrobiia bacterium]MBT8192683.1 hypothetical protein [Acidimicrobiia bacterium]MBT8248508.1 hypothetical protein [Acidimicrobiia bacterium]NNF87826.1 hypothetical protein [Acidimicrobiia bacterium]NNJ48411.1 hypothetical protein [Acidimicrobiia bacterium]